MPRPTEKDILEVHGMRFYYDGEEVWLWDTKQKLWYALPERPAYLAIVGGKLALIDIHTGRPKCNCDSFQVNNFGCKCGGV